MNISFVIFCYNESDNIEAVLQSLVSVIDLKKWHAEIVIVNDGSTDGTAGVCCKLADSHSIVKVINHEVNKGIGAALRTGYDAAKFEFVCAVPGDGQFDMNELIEIKEFSFNTYYSFYRPQTNYSFYRSVLTWLNRLFNQHTLGVMLRDVNWIKVYRKDQLELVNPKLTSSLVESEICAKLYKEGVMPIEIPSVYYPRKSGVSKGGSWKTLRKAMLDLVFLWIEVFKYNAKTE